MKIQTLITKSFIYTSFNFLLKLFSTPLILVLITLYLNQDLQGYWFTFGSLAALSTFADLGFTSIITQFTAHEFAYLEIVEKPYLVLVGNSLNLSRMASLYKFVISWSKKIILLAYPIIFLIGSYIFFRESGNCNWIFPWTIYVLGSFLNFYSNILFSFFEGCNQISEVQKIKIRSLLLMTTILIILLINGFNLFALSFSLLSSSIFSIIQIFIKYWKLIKQINDQNIIIILDWKSEVLRLIWKYAISFISGYISMQVFVPVVFTYYGSSAAGKVGMSISLYSSIAALSYIWAYIKVPELNILVSKKDWINLDKQFYSIMILIITTYIFGNGLFFVLYFSLSKYFDLSKRVLSPKYLFYLSLAWFFQIIINLISTYLRAHKEEPLYKVSLFLGIISLIITILSIKFIGVNYFYLGLLITNFLFLLVSIRVFYDRKSIWHKA